MQQKFRDFHFDVRGLTIT